jgi:hypothetical protein
MHSYVRGNWGCACRIRDKVELNLVNYAQLANVRNPDVAGVHNENDLNMLAQRC